MESDKVRAGIVGGAGYAGAELFRLLARHPRVQLEFITDLKYQGPMSRIYPQLGMAGDMNIEKPEAAAGKEIDLVFLCLPHRESMNTVAQYYQRGIKVIDLSADFRHQDPAVYEKWYGVKHLFPELCREVAVYGLPELFRDRIRGKRLVGNPGCYPTSAILGLAPLVKEKLVSTTGIVVDSKSGVTGAGRTPSPRTHFAEVSDSIAPYNPGRGHRHVGEIDDILSRLAGEEIRVTFTPYLAPMLRGILTTIYADLARDVSLEEILELYRSFYRDEPFVRILADTLPETRFIRNTNYCLISPRLVPDTGRITVFTAIDNLVKGASGTAVQNMNILFDFDETLGLL